MGNMVLANHTPENHEVVEDDGMNYAFKNSDDLAAKMQVNDDPALRETYNQQAIVRIVAKYSWNTVVAQYEALFTKMDSSVVAQIPAPLTGKK